MNISQLKNRPFRATVLLGTAFFILCSATSRISTNVDFSGEWKLNEGKSDLGQFGGRGAARKLKISAEADALNFERTSPSPSGEEITSKEKLTFDGKESESTVFGNSKKKSTAKWAEDGQSMVINSTILFDRNGDVMEIKIQETWKLNADGTLSIESNSSSSFGENTMKLVYDKVK
jgi:hypothetical protein